MKLKDDEEIESLNLIETMSAERDVPLNFGFVHLQNQDGDDIMRYMWADWGSPQIHRHTRSVNRA